MLHILLTFFFELLELVVVLHRCLLEVAVFHLELRLQLVDLATVQFLEPSKFVLESVVLN